MADQYVREAGYVEDMDGHRIPVGVDYDAVTIGPPLLQYRLNQVQAEEFAQLYVSACWQAGQNARQMADEIHDADGGDTAHTYTLAEIRDGTGFPDDALFVQRRGHRHG